MLRASCSFLLVLIASEPGGESVPLSGRTTGLANRNQVLRDIQSTLKEAVDAAADGTKGMTVPRYGDTTYDESDAYRSQRFVEEPTYGGSVRAEEIGAVDDLCSNSLSYTRKSCEAERARCQDTGTAGNDSSEDMAEENDEADEQIDENDAANAKTAGSAEDTNEGSDSSRSSSGGASSSTTSKASDGANNEQAGGVRTV
eukprot:g3766.t1